MAKARTKLPKVRVTGVGEVRPQEPGVDVEALLRRKMSKRLTGREDAPAEEQLKAVNDLLELARLVQVAARNRRGG